MAVRDPLDPARMRRSSSPAPMEGEQSISAKRGQLSEGLLSLRMRFGRLSAQLQRDALSVGSSLALDQQLAERQRLTAEVWQAISDCERGAEQLAEAARRNGLHSEVAVSPLADDKQDTDPAIDDLPDFDVTDTTDVQGDREPARKEPLRVLLVDDEPAVLRALARVLSRHYEVLTASNGAEALRLVLSGRAPDAIVCDLDMPRLDGSGFFAELRELQPQLLSRVVFCTGKAEGHRAQRLLSGLEAPVLHKPVRADTLLSVVQSVQSQ